jgi:hypothetical protein
MARKWPPSHQYDQALDRNERADDPLADTALAQPTWLSAG